MKLFFDSENFQKDAFSENRKQEDAGGFDTFSSEIRLS